MKQINSHNIEWVKEFITKNRFSIVVLISIVISTAVLYFYTQRVSHHFLADNSITLLSYLVGITALIAFTVTFFNSFASMNVKNAYYLGINRNLFRLSKRLGYSLISSIMFRGSLLLLYFIPIFLVLDKFVLSKIQSHINSLLLPFWYATFLFCLFSLILAVYNCLSLLGARSDKVDDMIETYYEKEFRETLIHYIETGEKVDPDAFSSKELPVGTISHIEIHKKVDPVELITNRINLFQGYEKFIYLYTILNDSEKRATDHTLFMNNDGQKDKSSIVSDRIPHIKEYFENKWKFLSTLKIEDWSELRTFIDGQYKRNTRLCLDICASWEEEYSKEVFECESEETHYSKQKVNQEQQIDTLLYTLLYKMASSCNKVYLHNADADPEEIIELYKTLNNAIDIGKNGNIQATQEVKKVLEETQKAIELDYLETAGEFLLTYPWQAREWQVWKVKENYIKLIYNKDRTELLHLLNKQNITDLVLLKAILEFLPIEQIIRHLIYTCAYSHRRYDVSPIVVKYELYKSIIQRKTTELDKLKKSSGFQTSLIGSISKDIDYYDIGYYLNDHIAKIIIDSIFSDGEIDQQLIDEIGGVFDIINYLALRSCLTSEYKVLSKISPDIAESPQKEDLRESIKRTQKNYPETIPIVMERLSEILQIK